MPIFEGSLEPLCRLMDSDLWHPWNFDIPRHASSACILRLLLRLLLLLLQAGIPMPKSCYTVQELGQRQ